MIALYLSFFSPVKSLTLLSVKNGLSLMLKRSRGGCCLEFGVVGRSGERVKSVYHLSDTTKRFHR